MKVTLRSLCLFVMLNAFYVRSQETAYQPLSFSLECASHDCPLLRGAPQTTGMRSGFVRLDPGKSVGQHSTNQNEEALIVLRGEGQVEVENRGVIQIASKMLAYIPPRSKHNVTNTGKDVLEYVYVVSPIGTSSQ